MGFVSKFLLPLVRNNMDTWPLTVCLGTASALVGLSFGWQLNTRDCKLKRVSGNTDSAVEGFQRGSGVLYFPVGVPRDAIPQEIKEAKQELGAYSV